MKNKYINVSHISEPKFRERIMNICEETSPLSGEVEVEFKEKEEEEIEVKSLSLDF